MASYSLQVAPSVPLTYLALFGSGAFLMRSAGCTINDMWDKNLDKAVGEVKLAATSVKTVAEDALHFRANEEPAACQRRSNLEPGVRLPGNPTVCGAGRAIAVELVQVRADVVRVGGGANSLPPSIALGASSLSVVTLYPFMKRITYWPQFVLGELRLFERRPSLSSA